MLTSHRYDSTLRSGGLLTIRTCDTSHAKNAKNSPALRRLSSSNVLTNTQYSAENMSRLADV